MKICVTMAGLAVLLVLPGDSSPRGVRGGGAGPAARPAAPQSGPATHTPSFSGGGPKAGQVKRPSDGGFVPQHASLGPKGPNAGPNRPNNGPDRPNSAPNHPIASSGNHPNLGPNRPNDGPNRPNSGPNHPIASAGPNRPNNGPDRPNNGPDRPNGGPDRPNVAIGNRPNVDVGGRQNTNVGGRQNTNVGGRENTGNRTNVGNQVGDRNNVVVNKPTTTNVVNRPVTVNRSTTVNNADVNRGNVNTGSRNRANAGNWDGRPSYNHYANAHAGWRTGSWNRYNWQPWGWGGAAAGSAAAAGWMGSGGDTYAYRNPYYTAPAATAAALPTPAVDYSQPLTLPPLPSLPAPAVTDDSGNQPPPEPEVPPEVDRLFSSARDSFKGGDYQRALSQDDEAIAKLPGDASLHEFRALCQFALKDYSAAAATIYAVLSAGPGWDWATLQGVYPDAAAYTNQLRALELYQKAHPEAADASFLLAYHYLVLDHPDTAAKQLENVVKLLPKDQLAQRLLQAIRPAQSDKPLPQH